jgi:hypothetical protein
MELATVANILWLSRYDSFLTFRVVSTGELVKFILIFIVIYFWDNNNFLNISPVRLLKSLEEKIYN